MDVPGSIPKIIFSFIIGTKVVKFFGKGKMKFRKGVRFRLFQTNLRLGCFISKESLTIFKMNTNFLSNAGLFILRIGVALLMLTHGIPKLELLLTGNASSFPDVIGLGSTFSLVLVVFAEVFCSAFLLLGLFTRWVSLPLIINMTVAVLVVHQGQALQNVELALMYLLIYMAISFLGSGDWSVDRHLREYVDLSKMKCKKWLRFLFI